MSYWCVQFKSYLPRKSSGVNSCSFSIFADMSSTIRQQKFARLIQKELSDIFQQDKRGILLNKMVTIPEVKVSPDLGVAKVFISMLLVDNKQQLLDNLNQRKNEVRRELGNRIRKQVRIVPELIFNIDVVEESAARIESLLNNLHIPPAGEKQK